jgi:hypothetical protein
MTINSGFVGGPVSQFFDNNGLLLSGGLVWSYQAGTTTPIATYPTLAAASAGTPTNTNPIILNSRGECQIVLGAPTKLVLEDANINPSTGHGNQIWSVDNIGQGGYNIYDANGNLLLNFSSASSAVNYIQIANSSAGNPVQINALGGDTNINLVVGAKGSGTITVTSPITSNTGQNLILTSSSGDQITANGARLAPKTTFQATVTAYNQPVTTGTPQKVTFNSKNWDAGNWFDDSTNYRYTPQLAGTYLFQLNVALNSSGASSAVPASLLLYKNGGLISQFNIVPFPINTVYILQSTVLAQANGSSDYFEVWVEQTSGTTLALNGGATVFSGSLIEQ